MFRVKSLTDPNFIISFCRRKNIFKILDIQKFSSRNYRSDQIENFRNKTKDKGMDQSAYQQIQLNDKIK